MGIHPGDSGSGVCDQGRGGSAAGPGYIHGMGYNGSHIAESEAASGPGDGDSRVRAWRNAEQWGEAAHQYDRQRKRHGERDEHEYERGAERGWQEHRDPDRGPVGCVGDGRRKQLREGRGEVWRNDGIYRCNEHGRPGAEQDRLGDAAWRRGRVRNVQRRAVR